MVEISAGIMLFRHGPAGPEVLLVHPGGPFWARKDAGAWTIPKGLVDAGEPMEAAARREFAEETGALFDRPLFALGVFRQPSGKRIHAFAAEGAFDPAGLASNTFELEWPPHSGRHESYPEIDRAGWFAPEAARHKLAKGQIAILDALLAHPALAPAGPGAARPPG